MSRPCDCNTYVTCDCPLPDEKDARIAELDAENQRLRDALRIYADPDTWSDDVWGVKAVNTLEYKDAGAAARQALLGGGENG